MSKISNSKQFEILVIGILNLFGIWILVFGFLLPAGSQAAWSEPTQTPTGGNASVPVYSEGIGQTIVGTLHVDPSGANAFPLKANGSDTAVLGTGTVNGLQGTSVGNALYGNLTANGANGGRSVYGLAVDAGDYGLYTSGGLGLGLASGDIWFLQRNAGVGFPHTNAAYGSVSALKVAADGETQIRSLGNGINFMKVTGASPGTLTSLATISEAGVLAVGGSPVCLQSGSGCPANASLWTPVAGGMYATNIGGDVAIGQGNTWDWGGNSDLYVVGGMRAMRYFDDDPTYYADLNAGANLNGTWTFNGPVNLNNITGNLGINMVPGPSAKLLIAQTASVEGLKIYQTGSSPKYSPISAVDAGGGDVFRVTENGDVKLIKDIYLNNGKSLRVDDIGANTTLYLGNYGESPAFAYGSGKTASLAVEGDVKGNQLCIQNDCKPNWAAIGNVSGWTLNGSNLYPNSTAYNVGIGNSNPGSYKLNVTGDIYAGNLLANALYSTTGNGGPASDIWVGDSNDTLQVQGNAKTGGAGSFGGYNPDASHKVTTPTFYTTRAEIGPVTGGLPSQDGDLNANRLCLQGDCKASWAAVSNASGWTDSGPFVYLTNTSDRTGIGINNAAAKLHIKPENLTEGLKIVSSDWSPLVIRNRTDSGDYLRINEDGVVTASGSLMAGSLKSGNLTLTGDTVFDSSSLNLNANANLYLQIDADGSHVSNFLKIVNSFGNVVMRVNDNGYVGIAPNSNTFFNLSNSSFPLEVRGGSGDVLAVGVTGNVGVAGAFCFGIEGNVVCKTDWGPNSSAYEADGGPYADIPDVRVYKQLPPGFSGLDYFCPTGYVVIGLRNSTPGWMICGRMW